MHTWTTESSEAKIPVLANGVDESYAELEVASVFVFGASSKGAPEGVASVETADARERDRVTVCVADMIRVVSAQMWWPRATLYQTKIVFGRFSFDNELSAA